MTATYVTYIIIAAIVIILGTWERSPFRIYRKSESRRAFVRTGFGGAKAVVGGGAFVIPLIHKIQWVDLGETKLTVIRRERESVMTKNLLRADMGVEFYVRVKADKESVTQAAIALGRRADNGELLRDFLEPKLLDTLQAVASEMTLEEIHQNRIEYSKRVSGLLLEGLKRKGLELTAVSLCSLNQTPIEYYDPDNVFDAEGLLAIKEKTEKRKKERNDIEQEQTLLVQEKNVEVRKRSLDVEKEHSFAEQDNRKAIESQKEQIERELTQFRLNQRLQSEEARITHEQEINEKEIAKERYLEEQRIIKERVVETAEIEKLKEIEEKRVITGKAVQTIGIHREIEIMGEKRKREEANIDMEKAIENLKIDKEKFLENQRIAKDLEIELAEINWKNQAREEQIEKEKTTQLAEINKKIELILEKRKQELAEIEKAEALEIASLSKQKSLASEEKAIALAKTEEIKAKTEQEGSEQDLLTVKIKSQAERQKMVAEIRAEEDAARQKIEKTIAVDMDVYKMKQTAQARFDAADEEAQAMERFAEANRKEALAKAEGERAMVEAKNLISEHILKSERNKALIGEMAKIAGELMKPAEKIDSIKVVHVDGFGTIPTTQVVQEEGEQSLLSYAGSQSAISTIINGILQVGAFKPVFKHLFGTDEIREMDPGRLVKILNEIVPGMVEQGGKEFVKQSVRKEVDRKEKLKTQKGEIPVEK